jgi:hypothetical protein
MSNFIQVSDKYAIASDSRQWMIKKSQNVTDKETKAVSVEWVSKSFYGNFEQCVVSLGQEMLRTSQSNSYAELVAASKEISDLLRLVLVDTTSLKMNNIVPDGE